MRFAPPPEAVGPEALDRGRAIGSPLALRQELALLYFHNPQLDPQGKRLDGLVWEMFRGKGDAIRKQDWPAMQEYHTVLGLIFAERGIWTTKPGEWRPASAIYQFEHALEAAQERLRRENFYQPLAELKARLAEGYRLTGSPGDAGRMYWYAALAYLDSDALREALTMLQKHRDFAGESDEAALLDKLVLYRSRSPGLATELTPERAPWLFRASPLRDESFLLRQRFKIAADHAQAGPADTAVQRLSSAYEAYQLVAKNGVPLVGAGDLLRWERVNALLLEVGNAAAAPTRLLPAVNPSAQGTKQTTLRLTLIGESSALRVPVGRETTLAGAIVAELGPAKALLLKDYVRIRGNTVVVRSQELPDDVDALVKQLARDSEIRVEKLFAGTKG